MAGDPEHPEMSGTNICPTSYTIVLVLADLAVPCAVVVQCPALPEAPAVPSMYMRMLLGMNLTDLLNRFQNMSFTSEHGAVCLTGRLDVRYLAVRQALGGGE